MAIILGNGSGFQIYLNGPHAAKIPQTGKTTPINVRKRILYVGDERQAVEMERNLLEDLGYRVTALTSSLRAWQEFCNRSEEFDLVVTDLNLPQLTGLELATELVKIRPDIPIIICFGVNEAVSPDITRKLNIREVLMKPARITDFVRAIRRALDSQRE